MKSIQIIKKVNNTEIGAASTHETYILVTQDMKVDDVFSETNKLYNFVDKKDNEVFPIRHVVGREQRIVGLGPFYRKHNFSAGDEIVIEKIINNGSEKYYLSSNQYKNSTILIKNTPGFEVLNLENIKDLSVEQNAVFKGKRCRAELRFSESKKKRADSPKETDYYKLIIDGKDETIQFGHNDMLELFQMNGALFINTFCAWKKYIIEVG